MSTLSVPYHNGELLRISWTTKKIVTNQWGASPIRARSSLTQHQREQLIHLLQQDTGSKAAARELNISRYAAEALERRYKLHSTLCPMEKPTKQHYPYDVKEVFTCCGALCLICQVCFLFIGFHVVFSATGSMGAAWAACGISYPV
ncbi:MAG: hypothetical protein Q4A03_01230 [Rothia sp. (in: high G+C Gram-positive bacteria)]|nr:hypothetical protein [Rothia sp. (in: high G+C Gram-positive bacteria)]